VLLVKGRVLIKDDRGVFAVNAVAVMKSLFGQKLAQALNMLRSKITQKLPMVLDVARPRVYLD